MTTTTPFTSGGVAVSTLDGGVVELRSTLPATRGPVSTLHWLRDWALRTPGAVLLSDVVDGERLFVDYAEMWMRVVAASTELAQAGVRPGDRVVVVAQNGVDSFVLGHAIMLSGAVWVPIAPQYLGAASDAARIGGVLDLVAPTLVVVPDDAQRSRMPPGHAVSGGSELLAGGAVHPSAVWALTRGDGLLDALARDMIAKLLLTSGSTGVPKAVVHTHGMLVDNATVTADVWRFVADHPPVLVDWLPWNHAFGGNQNVNMVLIGGGTLHIDDSFGRSVLRERSLDTLKRFRPTFYAAVPAGFHELLPDLASDAELRQALLGGTDAVFSAGASMPADTLGRLRELSGTVRARPVPVLTGWGSTECGPGATIVTSDDAEPGWIGPPLPGVTIRLVPTGAKTEVRVRGASVTPGYWGQPELTAAAFDDDGFFRSGDAGALVDPERPGLGLRFDGRLSNDFKLANGSWVNVERLRSSLMSLGGSDVQDVIVIGPDRPHLVAWFWLTPGSNLDPDDVTRRHNQNASGQTNTITAAARIDFDVADDLLSPKGLLKPTAFRAAHALRLEALYTTHIPHPTAGVDP